MSDTPSSEKEPETSGTRHPNTGELYPPDHPAHEFTTEEVEDILRFAEQHGLSVADEARLLTFIRDVRAAHLRKATSKREAVPWPQPEPKQ